MESLRLIISRYRRFVIETPSVQFSLIIILCIIALSTVLLSINIIGTTYDYEIGDIARENVRVSRDIHYVNDAETREERRKIGESVPLVFDRDGSVMQQRLNTVTVLFNNIAYTLKQYPPGGYDLTFQVYALKSSLTRNMEYDDIDLMEVMRYRDHEGLKKHMVQIIMYLYDHPEMGVLDRGYTNPLRINNTNAVIRTINAQEAADEYSRSLDSLKSLEERKKNTYAICSAIAPNLPRALIQAISHIIARDLEPNISFNIEETRRRLDVEKKNIKPIMGLLKKGQTIVREGDTITSDINNRLVIYNRQTSSYHVSYILGILMLQMVFFMIFGYYLLSYNRLLIPSRKSTTIILTLIIIFMIYTFFVSRTDVFSTNRLIFALLLPVAAVTMIVSILSNLYLSMMVGMYLVFFTTMISGGDIVTVILSFSTALLGMFINENVERRTDFLRGGLIIGLVNMLLIIAVAFMQEMPLMNAARVLHIAFANGVINSILVLGVLPVYENLFGLTTKFKLLELSDLNADIFKRMLLEAPGTYNHSLVVSTMAEAACKEINADHLLARVGAYYHDIGKIPDAGMYIENRVSDPRAKQMTSLEYSRLIISHVSTGVSLAQESGLPAAVIDFILEHHGRTVMTYFYHQALEAADSSRSDEIISKSDFQYPGPEPRSKETAVVMLADAIEAASRSLQQPSYQKLEGLVRKIIFNKLNDGELEFSNLSMSELTAIQQTFLKILSGIFHTRIEYPERSDIRKLEDRAQGKVNEG